MSPVFKTSTTLKSLLESLSDGMKEHNKDRRVCMAPVRINKTKKIIISINLRTLFVLFLVLKNNKKIGAININNVFIPLCIIKTTK